MKVLYIPTMNTGVIYWRIENYATHLLKVSGIKVYVDYFYPPQSNIAWDAICLEEGLEDAKNIQNKLYAAYDYFDVIIFQKIQNKQGLALISKMREQFPKTKIFAEVDDHIGDVTPSNFNIDKFKAHHKHAAHHCELSDGVICSTDYLAEHCKKFNENVFVAPLCIDPKTWKYRKNNKRAPNKKLTYGYVAGSGHDEDLYILNEGLKKCKDDVILKIRYGGHKPEFLTDERIDFKTVAWDIHEYPQRLYDLNIDIGLAPLRDTEFNRCKSNLKWLEWSSLSVPVIASDVEPYSKTNGSIMLRDNLNFDLTIDQKIKKEALFIENRKNYSITKNCHRLAKWLKSQI